MYKFRLPEGTQDYLPDSLYNKKKIQEKIMSVFRNNAYQKIQTPKLEYYDVFTSGVGAVPDNKLFKLTDNRRLFIGLKSGHDTSHCPHSIHQNAIGLSFTALLSCRLF
ncbi:MAG: ATP phosphoribosyltransferase regulatory subunit [Christensenellales bacterium]